MTERVVILNNLDLFLKWPVWPSCQLWYEVGHILMPRLLSLISKWFGDLSVHQKWLKCAVASSWIATQFPVPQMWIVMSIELAKTLEWPTQFLDVPVHYQRIRSPQVQHHRSAPLARLRVSPDQDLVVEESSLKRRRCSRRRVPAWGRCRPLKVGAHHHRHRYHLDVAALTRSSLLHTAVSKSKV